SSAALTRAARAFARLPSRSPTTGLSCATARARRSGIADGLLMLGPATGACVFSGAGGLAMLGRRAVLAQQLGDQECQFQRLIGIQARIAMGMIAVRQILGRDCARAAGAFGDILAGHLDMDAAGMRSFRRMDVEELLYLPEDALEGPGLVAVRSNG